ncbi:MAG TPA: acetate/propionate family kinase [Gaiellaceae bacterium]|nr:acetate/propionate family kinase [Gaiellaceae bacterium]
MRPVLVVNAGSTSTKLRVVAEGGAVENIESLAAARSLRVEGVGHRIVHGGSAFLEPVLIDESVRRRILALEPLAPLHNRPALAALAAAEESFPHVPHVAVFDSAFHATMPEEAAAYALPAAWREGWGIRRYGFHGISVAWCAERAPSLMGRSAAGLRLVVCHLGGGCSVTAVRAGSSVDTTMGFTPLEGVPMESRSGSVDPGALIYLLREHGLSVDELDDALNEKSGLKGLSGRSGDVRELESLVAGGDEPARLALAVYAHRIAAAVGAMTTALGGLDALAFTAGVGEHSAQVRAAVCGRLAFLGIELDAVANTNREGDADVAAPDSLVRVLVVTAREELVIAREVRRLLDGGDRLAAS